MIWPLFRFLGRNLSNFLVVFGKIKKIKKTFWNYLTFSASQLQIQLVLFSNDFYLFKAVFCFERIEILRKTIQFLLLIFCVIRCKDMRPLWQNETPLKISSLIEHAKTSKSLTDIRYLTDNRIMIRFHKAFEMVY